MHTTNNFDAKKQLKLIGNYLDVFSLVERLHGLLLKGINDEFEKLGVLELNVVQALLLLKKGDNEDAAGELKTCVSYQDSNVSYNQLIWDMCSTYGPRLNAALFAPS